MAFVGPFPETASQRLVLRRAGSATDPSISIARDHQTAPFLPAVSSLGGFRTPAPIPHDRPAKGRRPKPFTFDDIPARAPSVGIRSLATFSASRRCALA